MYTKENGELNGGKIVKHVVVGVLVLVVLFLSCGIVKAGQVGVKTRLGKVISLKTEGPYFNIPFIESVHKMDVKTRTINYDKNGKEGDASDTSQLFGASKDLQDVKIGVVVTYHVDPSKAGYIYSQYSSVDNYENNVIEPMVRQIVKSTSAGFTAEELVTKRPEYSDKVDTTLSTSFTEKSAILEDFSVTNFEFSKSFSDAIEAKVTAEQDALRAKNQLEQAKYEKEQKITQAQGEAESIRIQSQAINSQGGADYVELKKIEKWKGDVPQYMMGNTTPIINLR